MSKNELQHHGILGQKWGIRRYQNPDGSLTQEGEKRYNNGKTKGEYEKYEEKGLSKNDAFTAKYNNDKIKKVAMIAGGVALTAGAVYLGKRYIQNNIDTIVKSGTRMQTIMNSQSVDTGRKFYTSINGLDKIRYGAIAIQQGLDNKTVYNNTLIANKDFKIASNKSAQNVFMDLINNDNEFKKSVKSNLLDLETYANEDRKHKGLINRAVKEIKNGKIGKNSYELFNVSLVDNGLIGDSIKERFYNAMKSAGYAGVKDVNDMKYTNYWSINPAVIFDGEKNVSRLYSEEISKLHKNAGTGIILGQAAIKNLGPVVMGVKVGKFINKSNKTIHEPDKVAQYRKDHPESSKSYEEILKILYEKK